MTPTPLRKDAARNWDQIVAVGPCPGRPGHAAATERRRPPRGNRCRHRLPALRLAEALLETVATPCLEALAAHGEQALADPDPWRALEGFLTRTVEAQVGDASLAPVTAAADGRPASHHGTQESAVGRPAPRSWTGPALPERSAPIWPRATWSRSCAGSPTPYRSTAAAPPNGSTPLAATWPPCSGACGSHHPARDVRRRRRARPPAALRPPRKGGVDHLAVDARAVCRPALRGREAAARPKGVPPPPAHRRASS